MTTFGFQGNWCKGCSNKINYINSNYSWSSESLCKPVMLANFIFNVWSLMGKYYQSAFEKWIVTWWRHQMERFSALLALCAGNSPVTGKFPAQRPTTQSFYVFFDLRLNKWLSEHSWGWWLETLSRSLWRHCNDIKWLSPPLLTHWGLVTHKSTNWFIMGLVFGSSPVRCKAFTLKYCFWLSHLLVGPTGRSEIHWNWD